MFGPTPKAAAAAHLVARKLVSSPAFPRAVLAGACPSSATPVSAPATTIPRALGLFFITQQHAPSPPDLHHFPVPGLAPAPTNRLELHRSWFNQSFPRSWDMPQVPGSGSGRPPSDRHVKLGKTLDILKDGLPTILHKPPASEVLNPHVALHLFPSTYPHLPSTRGALAYNIALRTSPIVWGRIPFIKNRLQILSARMVTHQGTDIHASPEACGEQLVVRWRTVSDGEAAAGNEDTTAKKSPPPPSLTPSPGQSEQGRAARPDMEREHKAPVGMSEQVGSAREFTGLFIFEFDSEGRILSHTIEQVDQGSKWEDGFGAKMVNLTDRVLGNIKGGDPFPACARLPSRTRRRH